MAVAIRKVEGGYLGHVSPPDGRYWRSPAPSPLDAVRAQLQELGATGLSIANALDAADRSWRARVIEIIEPTEDDRNS